MKAKLVVRLKSEVPDFQGDAVKSRLVEMGFGEVAQVRIGKVIEFELEAADREAMRERLDKMCAELLANTVTEDYELEVLE